MSETPFFKTAMGRDFFDRNIPLLVKELQKLNKNLADLLQKMEDKKEKTDADPRGTAGTGVGDGDGGR